MDNKLVFFKTRKGEEELKERTHRLPQKLRTVLILIDGEKNVGTLSEYATGIIDSLYDKLEGLAMDGFISVKHNEWKPSRRATDTAVEGAGPDVTAVIKDKLIDAAILVLGEAGDKVVQKIGNSGTSIEELQQTIARCEKIASLVINKEQCEDLKQHFDRILSEVVDEPLPGTEAASADGEADTGSVESVREALLAALQTTLGHNADMVSETIRNAAGNMQDLEVAVGKCRKAVRLFIDESLEAELATRCGEILRAS